MELACAQVRAGKVGKGALVEALRHLSGAEALHGPVSQPAAAVWLQLLCGDLIQPTSSKPRWA